MTNLIFDKSVEEEFDVKWNQSDFTFSILGGQAKFTPEFVFDIQSYYDLSSREMFQIVREAIVRSKTKEEVDVVVRIVPAYRRTKEAIFKMMIITSDTKTQLFETYFSTAPIVPTEIKTK